MTQKIKIIVLALLFMPVFANAASPIQYLQRIGWDKEKYAAWYEVTVDAEKDSGIWNTIISKQKTELTDLSLQLEPGRYRFRVQSFNAEGVGGGISEWMLFDVRAINPASAQAAAQAPQPPAEPAGAAAGAAAPALTKRHLSFGLGLEMNANSHTGLSYGARLNVEIGITNDLAFGFMPTASYNFYETYTLEPAFFLRWYAIRLGTWGSIFLQGDTGNSYIFVADSSVRGEFLGGASGGMRITFGSFYVEPIFRCGLPFLWGAGLSFGWTRG
jgi:hypothetical protein